MEKSYFVHASSYVDDDVEIGEGTKIWHFCHIQKGAKIIDSVLMPNVTVEEGAVVRNCIVAEGLEIPAGANIGTKDKIELIARKEQVE